MSNNFGEMSVLGLPNLFGFLWLQAIIHVSIVFEVFKQLLLQKHLSNHAQIVVKY